MKPVRQEMVGIGYHTTTSRVNEREDLALKGRRGLGCEGAVQLQQMA
jgi:hypothetical protein